MTLENDDLITQLKENNKTYQKKHSNEFKNNINGQNPKIAVLTCSDSRVIPENIFQLSIGNLFVVRVAGNIAVDKTVIESLEYAVSHLKISHLIILGHTGCGAIKEAFENKKTDSFLLNEIKKSFLDNKNPVLYNLKRQLKLLPDRSKVIKKAVDENSLKLISCMYYIEDGHIEFLD